MDTRKFQSVVGKLETARDKNGNKLNMDSIIVSYGSEIFKHNFKDEDAQNDLRSLCKPIIAISIGMAIENGLKINGELLSLETKIFPFFKDLVKIKKRKNFSF